MQKMTTNLKKELKTSIKGRIHATNMQLLFVAKQNYRNEKKKSKMLQNSSHILLEISLQNDKVQNTRQFGIKI